MPRDLVWTMLAAARGDPPAIPSVKLKEILKKFRMHMKAQGGIVKLIHKFQSPDGGITDDNMRLLIQECTGAGHMLQISDEDVNRVRTFGVTPANKYSLPPPALSLPVPPSFLPIPLPSPTFRLKSSISRMHICADAQNTRLHVHTLKRMHTHKTRARTHALAHTGGGAQANVQMYTKEGFVDYAATNSNKQIDPEAMANAIARWARDQELSKNLLEAKYKEMKASGRTPSAASTLPAAFGQTKSANIGAASSIASAPQNWLESWFNCTACCSATSNQAELRDQNFKGIPPPHSVVLAVQPNLHTSSPALSSASRHSFQSSPLGPDANPWGSNAMYSSITSSSPSRHRMPPQINSPPRDGKVRPYFDGH
eukprot:Tamp_16208.p1 GENE.Tamp_16208~~Tamp_16208.p1  ORF type:complete len:411 (+),score=26.16 Tamp_16208:128-1234(+)